MIENNRKDLINGLIATVFLGFVFSCFQAYEYHHAAFTIDGNIYGSTFYMATGFPWFSRYNWNNIFRLFACIDHLKVTLNPITILVRSSKFGTGTLLMLFGYFFLPPFIFGEARNT